jgi:BASS family bile acid:Na+ symporter
MLLALCRGGVTTDFASKIAYGNVARSATLTAVISLINSLTARPLRDGPLSFMEDVASAVSDTSLVIAGN